MDFTTVLDAFEKATITAAQEAEAGRTGDLYEKRARQAHVFRMRLVDMYTLSEVENVLESRPRLLKAVELAEHFQRSTEAAEREAAELRAALEAVEWIGSVGTPRCPWCHRMYAEGHAIDCQRQKLLNR
jgi:hypothetical protein